MLYSWEVDGASESQVPTVILVHGWGGRAADLAIFVRPLVERKLQVLACDLPAHGFADGDLLLIDEAMAFLVELIRYLSGPIMIIAYSFGAAIASLCYADCSDRVEAMALIAAPDRLSDVLSEFCRSAAFTREETDLLLEDMNKLLGGQVEQLAVSAALRDSNFNPLLVHGGLDQIIPLSVAQRNAEVLHVRLFEVEGADHQSILLSRTAAAAVLEAVGAFAGF